MLIGKASNAGLAARADKGINIFNYPNSLASKRHRRARERLVPRSPAETGRATNRPRRDDQAKAIVRLLTLRRSSSGADSSACRRSVARFDPGHSARRIPTIPPQDRASNRSGRAWPIPPKHARADTPAAGRSTRRARWWMPPSTTCMSRSVQGQHGARLQGIT